jgi:hypothetical protein
MAIGGYSINGYRCLFYSWLLVAIIFMAIGDYWWLFYSWLLIDILLVAIGGYSIHGY